MTAQPTDLIGARSKECGRTALSERGFSAHLTWPWEAERMDPAFRTELKARMRSKANPKGRMGRNLSAHDYTSLLLTHEILSFVLVQGETFLRAHGVGAIRLSHADARHAVETKRIAVSEIVGKANQTKLQEIYDVVIEQFKDISRFERKSRTKKDEIWEGEYPLRRYAILSRERNIDASASPFASLLRRLRVPPVPPSRVEALGRAGCPPHDQSRIHRLSHGRENSRAKVAALRFEVSVSAIPSSATVRPSFHHASHCIVHRILTSNPPSLVVRAFSKGCF